MVLFILVYFAACAAAAAPRIPEHAGLAGAGVEMTPDGNAIQVSDTAIIIYRRIMISLQ